MDFTYITVLDFASGKVYQYNLADVGDNYLFEDKDEPQCEEVEKLLIDQGHDLSDIQWMIHADPTLNQIKL
jgi:hypothetical protein